MRKLLFLLVLATVLWSGYWFAGSTVLRQGAEQWFADQAAQGITAEKTALTVAGFPNRFDLTVEGVRIADPQTGIGWQAPFAQIFAMTWKPWHIIAALPPEQVVTLPDQEVIVTSDTLRASVRTAPATDLPLAAVILEATSFSATSTAGWTVGAGRSVAALRADEEVEGVTDTPNAYIATLDIADLAPDPAVVTPIATEAGLPLTLSAVSILATATLSAPLDRHSGDAQPQLLSLNLGQALVTWGDLKVTAAGTIAPDAEGYAAGRIEVAITKWERLVPILVAAGAVKPEISQTVQNMLQALANEGGDPAVLKLPLVLEGGRMSFGPLPLGEAPSMRAPTG
jgi:hypothetical protein